jgi:hypothetical protein
MHIYIQTATGIQQQYAFGVKVPEHNKAFKDNNIQSIENGGKNKYIYIYIYVYI